jgi:hypothetical protein
MKHPTEFGCAFVGEGWRSGHEPPPDGHPGLALAHPGSPDTPRTETGVATRPNPFNLCNQEKRPFQDEIITAHKVAARALDGWMA